MANRPYNLLMAVVPVDMRSLYAPRRNRVEFVDVPEFTIIAVDGTGAPESIAFQQVIEALYSVSYTAHFLLKSEDGTAPKVMPLEGLWWMAGNRALSFVKEVAAGHASMSDSDRNNWKWSLRIVQLKPLNEKVLLAAILKAGEKKPNSALAQVRVEEFTEGRAAQILHVGPYSDEARSIVALHEGISDAGYRPRGKHHEIYLGDPRRAAPERLRTILRHPIE